MDSRSKEMEEKRIMEQTLILIKPDGVQLCLVGRIIQRFEDAGLKMVGMKMVWVDEAFAKKHYTQDLADRRGEFVRTKMLRFLQQGPVIAICLEGINAI